ncbi:hypothetical protein E2C01_083468 [Portunus trituberculatus]|uniref:Uncharacterized protein n=1 Tax=Portunus trituberculatus TaxID=210409 RepID=A0A5B7J6N3_PORTR|nr:hypothetical protein [Portunus trituberculatus]
MNHHIINHFDPSHHQLAYQSISSLIGALITFKNSPKYFTCHSSTPDLGTNSTRRTRNTYLS